jgi:hypothetical protein
VPLSPSHARHTPVAASHTGAAVGHSELVEQPQTLVSDRQIGLVAVHAPALATEHSTHRPLRHTPFAVVGQAAEVAAPLSPLHAPQVLVVALQTGLLAGQSLLVAHTQVLLTVLQTGDVGVHADEFEAEHCSQRPPTHAGSAVVEHASDAAEPRSPLHALHVREPRSQMGVAAGHWELSSHPQVSVDSMQTGVVPPQAASLVSEHSLQAPATQAGAFAEGQGSVVVEALSPSHASQVPFDPFAPLQTGADAGHSELLAHPHVPLLSSQVGVVTPHAVLLVAEHWAHAPLGRQAGAPDSGQASVAEEPKSPLHGPQVLPLGSHIGAVAGQLEFEAHPQVPLATLHVGCPPVHAVALVAEHCSHRPLTQARRAAVGQASAPLEPASLMQALQT